MSIGNPHRQRDQQYRLIQRMKSRFIHHQQPVLSVDAKKREWIGNFKNVGQRYCQQADSVNTYGFPSEASHQATPYGVYDAQANHAFVNVGTSATTSQFAVTAIRRWWISRYPKATHLLIEADAGGCNGYRPRLWKWERQQLANDTELAITVVHYPTGA